MIGMQHQGRNEVRVKQNTGNRKLLWAHTACVTALKVALQFCRNREGAEAGPFRQSMMERQKQDKVVSPCII